MKERLLILAYLVAIFASCFILFSSCATPRYNQYGPYVIKESRCPVYPSTTHYRAFGKRFNPQNCNFVYK